MTNNKDMCNVSEPSRSTHASQDEIPPSLAPKMLAMMKAIDELQEGLEPLIEKPHHEILAKLTPLERAKIQVMEAYTVNSLFWALMKISMETDTAKLEADYKFEMTRLKNAQRRVGDIEAHASMHRIDQAAVRRFVQRGLGMSSKRKSDGAKSENLAEEEEATVQLEEEVASTRPMKKKKSKIQADIDNSWQ